MSSRYVFVTGHEFGQRALQGMLASNAGLDGQLACVGVFGLAAQSAAQTVGFSDIRTTAEAHSIAYTEVSDPSLASHIDAFERTQPHYIVVIGWSRLISAAVLDWPCRRWNGDSGPRNAPAYGCIGMHPTALPEGRGQAPLPWTIIKQKTASAVTTFFLEDAADVGAIIQQHPLTIRPNETSTTLFYRVADLHFHAGAALADPMARHDLGSRPQDDAKASVWPKRRPADSRLGSFADAGLVERTVRALTWPYPAAFVEFGSTRLRIVGAAVRGDATDAPDGTVLDQDEGGISVAAGTARLHMEIHAADAAPYARLGNIVGRTVTR